MHESDEDYDSMVDNGTDDSENDSEVDSGCGQFVKAPKASPKKRKLPQNVEVDTEDDEEAKRSKMMKQLYKPPTVEEINHLKETENFFHSNLFRMQVDELLKEVKKPQKYAKFINEWVGKFRKFLKSLQNQDEPVPLAEIVYKNVVYPLTLRNMDKYEKDTFKFLQQKNVEIIGSQKIGTNIGKPISVDLCLEMPEKCLKKEDYLNAKYHHKRAHYLCHIAENLFGHEIIEKLNFVHFKNDSIKPVLEIVPKSEKYGHKVSFLLHVVCPDKFKKIRFLPEKNNVRKSMISKNEENEEPVPTQHYNSSIGFDTFMLKNQNLIESQIHSEAVKDAIILLKVWAKQRNFDKGYYGFDGGLITFYITYLLQNRKIYNSMSCYQIIRLFWNSLANSSWNASGISLCPESRENLEIFKKYFDVVFLDTSGFMNICANLSVDLYLRMKYECTVAINLLDNKKTNSFQLLFLTKHPFYVKFDHILSLRKPKRIQKLVEEFGKDEDKMNYYESWYPHIRKMIGDVLRKGLSDRILTIVPFQIGEHLNWPVSSKIPDEMLINFGIILNPVEAFRIVDKGPEATNAIAAEEYRRFWGGKCELRRFKDGSITESCVWGKSSDPIGEKRLICKNICLHLLNVHFDLNMGIDYFADQFDVAIRTKHSAINETNEEKSLKVIRSFDQLSRMLKDLDGLPLAINSILGIDPVFRYASVDPPVPTAISYHVEDKDVFLAGHVIECIVQLETSGKWPEKLEAIQRLKAAFYIQIAKSISTQLSNAEVKASFEYLDIIYDKYLFRMKIVNQREINLMREFVSEKNNLTKLLKDSEESVKLEIDVNIMPKMTSILHGMQQQYMSYGAVACLAKRWLYSQLIDPFLWPEICTELIVASIYMKQEPTIQPQTGFLRFLEYVANTDWSKEMILLNFNGDLSDETVEDLERQFTSKRSKFPPLCLVTSCDANRYGIFAKNGPAVEILNHVSVLAKRTVEILESNFFSFQKYFKDIFTPSITGYDLIIHLNSSIIPTINIFDVADFNKRNEVSLVAPNEKNQAAGFNPVKFYLNELREGYKNFAIFFYDPCGGDKIAVLWQPDALERKPFTTTNITGRNLEGDSLVLNKETIIQDFEIIGKGLVTKIERKNC